MAKKLGNASPGIAAKQRIGTGLLAPGLLAVVEVTGVLTSEGVECPALRGDDGQLYTLIGVNRQQLKPGHRVRIEGEPRAAGKCMQGQTLLVKKFERID